MSTTTSQPWTIQDAATAIKQAIEQSPPRRRRRIWIGEFKGLAAIRDTEENGIWGAEDTDFQFMARSQFDGETHVCGLPLATQFVITVHVAQRHGWTLEDGSPTATEARLWRLA